MGDRPIEEIVELGHLSTFQDTVQLKPTMVAGPILGITQGLILQENDLLLTVRIGELPEQRIQVIKANTPPYHIYFQYPNAGLNLWYQRADTDLERDMLIALVENTGPVNIYFGDAKPQFTASDLPGAYSEKEDLSGMEKLILDINKSSHYQTRLRDDELKILERDIKQNQQLQLEAPETDFNLFLKTRKNNGIKRKNVTQQSHHPASVALLMALIPTGGWALFNTGAFQLSATSALAINSLVVPPFAALFITNTYEELAIQAYLKKHNCNKQDIPPHVAKQITTRSYYMGAQFIAGSAISQIMAFAVLNELSKTLSGGAMIGGAPLEAQMLMMALSGIIFGASMLAVKMVEAYNNGKKLNSAQIISTFVTGLMAGMGFYLASIIPGLNHAYGAGMPNWSSSLASCLGFMAVLAGTFGPYMHISHALDEKNNPLPAPTQSTVLMSERVKDKSSNYETQQPTQHLKATNTNCYIKHY